MKVDKELIQSVINEVSKLVQGPIVLGGSASLVTLGLIDREIHDVDIFTTIDLELLNKCSHRRNSYCYEYYQLFCPDLNNVDLFMISKGVIKYYEIEWNGLHLNVMNPYETIYAKTLSYHKKHLEDIKCISKVIELGLRDEKRIVVE